jgi:HSP20 family protein
MKSGGFLRTPMTTSERQRMSDITTRDKEVKVVIEMSGVPKDKIKIIAYEVKIEVTNNDPKRKYHEVISIPPEADIETMKSTYNNGILEIVFNKKTQKTGQGKQVKNGITLLNF